ncbi:hypothetical protein ES288_D11G343400v1 [Gossypium darwinii]|uniref:Uncharacterized protein n=1 Tax=Gossypium darwinii TaxID=34276 RepID=A0A5D2ATR3_GOSDA|nr:hypothetical protein ES288_D11G343400v1 [Gossypium darwinii]
MFPCHLNGTVSGNNNGTCQADRAIAGAAAPLTVIGDQSNAKAEASGLEGQKKRNPHGLLSVPISPTKAVPATDLACGPSPHYKGPILAFIAKYNCSYLLFMFFFIFLSTACLLLLQGMAGVGGAGAEQRRARGWAEAGAARPRHAAPRVFCCKHFVFFYLG